MSEFLSSLESEKGLERLRAHLAEADELVWSSPLFPRELRPDIAAIGSRYRIGQPGVAEVGLVIHPQIQSPLRESIVDAKKRHDREFSLNKIASYEPDTDETIFHPLVFVDDRIAKRTVYHEAATAKYLQKRIKPSSDYSDFERQAAQEILGMLSVGDLIPLESTLIKKMGFRKLLMADGYALGELVRPELFCLNEILPTGFEIITEQAIHFPGGIRALDQRIRCGKVAFTAKEDHPRFARALFQLSRSVDWRAILSAFIPGEARELPSVFEGRFGDNGLRSLAILFKTISDDEENILDHNRQSSLLL